MENNKIRETKYGWVDLSNIHEKNGRLSWQESIGATIPFKHKDITAEIVIRSIIDKDNVCVDIPGYITNKKVRTYYIKYGKLGKCVGRYKSIFKFNIGDVVNDIEILDMYVKNGRKHLWCKCLVDGYEWDVREDHFITSRHCPRCTKYIGEQCIKNYLIEHNIEFIPQYSFDDCRYIKILYFDFYLPKFNTCIEYDGEQHFKPVDFAGKGEKWAEQQFAQIQIRDNVKNVYCIDNSIQLLRIKYTENIETVLDDFLTRK